MNFLSLKKLHIYLTHENETRLLEQRELDVNGNVILEIAYHKNGAIKEKVLHTYFENKVLQSNYFLGDHQASHTVSFNYNEKGQVIKESTWYADGSLSIQYISRDTVSNQDTIITEDENGVLESKEVTCYNEKHQPLETFLYDKNNQELEHHTYNYDEHGEITYYESHVEGQPSIINRFEYIRNEEGQIIEILHFDEKNRPLTKSIRTYTLGRQQLSTLEETNYLLQRYEKTIWQYDDKGNNVVVLQYNERGDMTLEIEMDYNERNQIISEESRSAQHGVVFKEYIREYFTEEEIQSTIH